MMKYRLDRNEKLAIRERYADDVIFKFIQTVCKPLESTWFPVVRLSPEEVFFECYSAFDGIIARPTDAKNEMRCYWDTLYCDLTDLTEREECKTQIETSASVMVDCLLVLLSQREKPLCRTIVVELMMAVQQKSPDWKNIQDKVMAGFERIGEEKLKAAVNEYFDSKKTLSKEIEQLLKDCPKEEPIKEESGETGDKLTITQLIILFSQTYNIALSSEYTNIQQFAGFLSRVSGHKQGSIRQRIMQGIDYENPNIKKEARTLAEMISPFNSEIAQRILNDIEN